MMQLRCLCVEIQGSSTDYGAASACVGLIIADIYRPALTALVEGELQNGLGRDVELVLEEDTTLPGAAAAALLNLH